MREELPLTQLLVDPENPRLEVQPNSRDAVRELFKSQSKKMLRLVENIVERGRLSPLEKIGVSPSNQFNGKYLVGEGNRRVAALMALHRPDVLKGVLPASNEKSLRALSTSFLAKNPSRTIECEVLTEDELQPWITLRHTGENEGAGLVPWGAVEQDRYLERTSGKKALALQFLDRYSDYVKGDPVEVESVAKVPSSNLERLMESKPIRERLGITINDHGWAHSDYPPNEMRKWLRRVVHDLASGKVNVGDLYDTQHMLDYVESFSVNELPDPATKLQEPIPVEPVASAASAPTSKKVAKTPIARKWSLKGLKIRPAHSRLTEMITELEHIPIDSAPNVHGIMLRVFVELATDDYIRRHKMYVTGSKAGEPTLKQKINAVAEHLKSADKLDSKQVAAVNRATAHERFHSTKTLQQYVHNEHFHPSPTDVATMWKNIGGYLAALE